jgi:small subunit ribosomal protein S20
VANSRSARKRIRANQHKFERNRAVRSSVRTKVGKARRALLGVDAELDASAQLLVAISALDRAAEKGVLHANNAARRKSRLMALANKLEAAAAEGAGEQSAARAAAVGGQKGRKTAGRSGAATGAAKPAARRTTAATGKAPAAKSAVRRTTAAAGTASAAKGQAAPRTDAEPSKSTRPAKG